MSPLPSASLRYREMHQGLLYCWPSGRAGVHVGRGGSLFRLQQNPCCLRPEDLFVFLAKILLQQRVPLVKHLETTSIVQSTFNAAYRLTRTCMKHAYEAD